MVVKEATEISQSMIVMDCEVSQSLCESDGVETAQKVYGVTVTFERGETIYFPDVSQRRRKRRDWLRFCREKICCLRRCTTWCSILCMERMRDTLKSVCS